MTTGSTSSSPASAVRIWATLDGRSSRYFEDIVSFPFVPGHEVVGVSGRTAVVDYAGTALAPAAPGPSSSRPRLRYPATYPKKAALPRVRDRPLLGLRENLAFGDLSPGLQTGFCADTGGGWSAAGLVAHPPSSIRFPKNSPTRTRSSSSRPPARRMPPSPAGSEADDTVAVVGAGTLGLATIAALHHLVRPTAACTMVAGAKHPHQRRVAEWLGADTVDPPDQLARAVRRQAGSLVLAGRLTGGADVVFDCVGSSESLTQSLAMVRPRGRVVVVGMPAKVSVDLAPLWHRELTLVGAYAYGTAIRSRNQ